MRLTGKELDRLTIYTLAEFARRRRARGRRLNAPEAVAVVCDEILEWAWDGVPRDQIIERAAGLLGRHDVMEGVPSIVTRIEIDALFPAGSALVVVPEPFGPADDEGPGAVTPAEGPVTVNTGGAPVEASVRNTADVPIEVSSHYHFFEANRLLRYDRRLGYGMRLDIPAGASIRWEPGEQKTVPLVPLEGARQAWGFGGLVDGPLDVSAAGAAVEDAVRRGYAHEQDPDAD